MSRARPGLQTRLMALQLLAGLEGRAADGALVRLEASSSPGQGWPASRMRVLRGGTGDLRCEA
jgi:hypothetical protein